MSATTPTTHVPRRVFRDRRTGREVWQVSPDHCGNAAPYMYHAAFAPDEKHLFYTADEPAGQRVQRLEIASGATTALTPPGSRGWNLHPNGRELFYARGPRVQALDLETLEERTAVDLGRWPELRDPHPHFMFSPSGRWFLAAFTHAPGQHGIARVACDGSEMQIVFRRDAQVAHLMFCPASDDLISFCARPDRQNEMDAPPQVRTHIWLLDARTGAVESFLLAPVGFRVTHSYWSPDGGRLYYHKKTQPGWTPTWLAYLERSRRQEVIFYGSPDRKLGHSFVAPDQKCVVTDNQQPHDNELILVEVATGKAEILCWPDSANHENEDRVFGNHVHPSFSPTGRYVVYTSDVTGRPQVYLVPRW